MKPGDPHTPERRRHHDHLRGAQRRRSGSAPTAAVPTCSTRRRGRIRQLPYGSAAGRGQRTQRHGDRRGRARQSLDRHRRRRPRPRARRTARCSRCSATIPDDLEHAAGQHRVRARGRCPTVASGSAPTAAASRGWSDPPQHRMRSASRSSSRDEGLSSDTVYGVVADAARPHLAQRQCRPDALRPGDAAASRPTTASTACRARSSTSAPTTGCATGGCASAAPADSTSSIPRACRENRQPPRVALTRVEVLGVPAPGATPYWLLDRIALDYRGQHRVARLRRARFHLAASATASPTAWRA